MFHSCSIFVLSRLVLRRTVLKKFLFIFVNIYGTFVLPLNLFTHIILVDLLTMQKVYVKRNDNLTFKNKNSNLKRFIYRVIVIQRFLFLIFFIFEKYKCNQFYSKKAWICICQSKLVLLGSLKRHILNSLKSSQ